MTSTSMSPTQEWEKWEKLGEVDAVVGGPLGDLFRQLADRIATKL